MNTLFQTIKQKETGTKCPKCGSNKISNCPGGSSLEKINNINWICSECLYEW